MGIVAQHKNFIIIVGTGLLIAAAFLFLSKADTENPGAAAALSAETRAQLERSAEIEREIIQELRKIQSITFDDSLYEDPSFQNLVDFSRPIESQPVGRANPFAPLGEQ